MKSKKRRARPPEGLLFDLHPGEAPLERSSPDDVSAATDRTLRRRGVQVDAHLRRIARERFGP